MQLSATLSTEEITEEVDAIWMDQELHSALPCIAPELPLVADCLLWRIYFFYDINIIVTKKALNLCVKTSVLEESDCQVVKE